MTDRLGRIPYVDGILTPAQVAETAASIAAMQEPDGAIPWTTGAAHRRLEPRRGGHGAARRRARSRPPSAPTPGAVATQREDGSWPMKIVGGRGRGRPAARPTCRRTSPSASGTTGWSGATSRSCAGSGRRSGAGLDWVVSMQLPFGGIAWSQEWDDGRPGAASTRTRCWRARRASTSRCAPACALADAGRRAAAGVGARRRPAGARAARAPRPVPGQVARSRWTGTTRSSAAPSAARPAPALIEDPLGRLRRAGPRHPLRRHQPVGDRRRDLRAGAGARRARGPRRALRAARRHAAPARARTASYWTGYVFPDDVNWPGEQTTYTAAAVILAVDALGETHGHATGGPDIMRGTSLAPHFAELALECGCPSADRVAGVPARTP